MVATLRIGVRGLTGLTGATGATGPAGPNGADGSPPQQGALLDNSMLEGDLLAPQWRTIASGYKPNMRMNAAARTAPDGQVYQDATHWNSYPNGQGITWNVIYHAAQFSGPMTFTLPAWLAPGRSVDKISLVIGDTATPPNPLAQTLCTLTGAQQDFSVTYSVTVGTIYTLAIRQDDDGTYGSASAQALLGRPRLTYANATGILASSIYRIPGKPRYFQGTGRNIIGSYGYYTSPLAEIPIRTNAPSIVIESECTDNTLADGYSAITVSISSPGEVATPWYQVSPTVVTLPHLYPVSLPSDGKVRDVRIANSPHSGNMSVGHWIHAVYVPQGYTCEILDPDNEQVLAVGGDSISQGQTAITSNTYDWAGGRSIWTALRARYPGRIVHEGGGGLRLSSWGWQYISGVLQTGAAYTVTRPDVLRAFTRQRPSEILILIGTNDWAAGYSKADFKSAYTLFVDELRGACNVPMWLVGPPHRNGDTVANAGSAIISDFNDAISELVAANDASGLPRSRFATFIAGTSLLTNAEIALGDGIHPPSKMVAKAADLLSLAMGW